LERYKQFVSAELAKTMSSERISKIETKFQHFMKVLLHQVAILSHPKEFKNFIIDLIERVYTVYTGIITPNEQKELFAAMIRAIDSLADVLNAKKRARAVDLWKRFLSCISACLSSLS